MKLHTKKSIQLSEKELKDIESILVLVQDYGQEGSLLLRQRIEELLFRAYILGRCHIGG